MIEAFATNWRRAGLWLAFLLVTTTSCSTDFGINNTASLGGTTPGGRGKLDIIFDNRTQYRAIFTFGVYDYQDKTSVPTYGQFAVQNTLDATQFNRGLQPMTTTTIGSFTPNCGRLVSFGGEEMINRIQTNKAQPFNNAPTVDAAFRTGIYFTTAPLDDPDANAETNPSLVLEPVNSYLGTDFACDARLVFEFVPDPNNSENVVVNVTTILESSQ
jgi:hypothetical protein